MIEQEYKTEIYQKASKVKSKEELIILLDEIMNFKHDYGTIVYGCMAAIRASFNVVNRSPHGGISGFQAGCLGWECIHDFMMIKSPAKILDFNNMLYPQYEYKFDKTISQKTWDLLQKEANSLLKKKDAHPAVIAHWKKCANGEIPFGYRIAEND
jgi:hypothetical protein